MSHSELNKAIFAGAHEWRRMRASVAADVRHGHGDRAQEVRKALPALRQLGELRGCVHYAPGIFELGTKHADWFYESVDQWGSILAPSAFQAPSP